MSRAVRKPKPQAYRSLAERLIDFESTLQGGDSLCDVEVPAPEWIELLEVAQHELAAQEQSRGGMQSSVDVLKFVRADAAELAALREFRSKAALAAGFTTNDDGALLNAITVARDAALSAEEFRRTAQRVDDVEAFREQANARIAELEAAYAEADKDRAHLLIEVKSLREFKVNASHGIATITPELEQLREFKAKSFSLERQAQLAEFAKGWDGKDDELIELRAFKVEAETTIKQLVAEADSLRDFRGCIGDRLGLVENFHRDAAFGAIDHALECEVSLDETAKELLSLREFVAGVGNAFSVTAPPFPLPTLLENVQKARASSFEAAKVISDSQLWSETRAELEGLREFRGRVANVLLKEPETDADKLIDLIANDRSDDAEELRELRAFKGDLEAIFGTSSTTTPELCVLVRQAQRAYREGRTEALKYRVEYVGTDDKQMIAGKFWATRQEAVDHGKKSLAGRVFEVVDQHGKVWDSVAAPEKKSRAKKKPAAPCIWCDETGHAAEDCALRPGDVERERHRAATFDPLPPPKKTPPKDDRQIDFTQQLKKPTRKTKKFPLGTGLAEKCTKCGAQLGEHDGTRCPKARAA